MQAITEHAKKHGHVSKIVKLDWLRDCLQQRSLLPVAKKLMLDSTALLAVVAQQKAEAAARLQPAQSVALQATQVIHDNVKVFIPMFCLHKSRLPVTQV